MPARDERQQEMHDAEMACLLNAQAEARAALASTERVDDLALERIGALVRARLAVVGWRVDLQRWKQEHGL